MELIFILFGIIVVAAIIVKASNKSNKTNVIPKNSQRDLTLSSDDIIRLRETVGKFKKGEKHYCNDCDTGLRKVVSDWLNLTLRSSVAVKYGSIEDWDLSEVTNLKCIFYRLLNFNADISKWRTSGVTTLQGSENHQYHFLYQFTFCFLSIE